MRSLACVFAFDEGEKLRRVLEAFPARRDYDVAVVDDGSRDGSTAEVPGRGFELLRDPVNRGLGTAIQRAFHFVLAHNYDVLVIMAGNGKDDPAEIPRLLAPIASGSADFVQGSRYLEGGGHGNMPVYRQLATRWVHPLLFRLLTGVAVTETTNGFRALRSNLLRDPAMRWNEAWLSGYELEQYVQFQTVRLGYARVEVPVHKTYPADRKGYTKVRPISGWWSMVKPLLWLALRIRR